MRRDLQARTWRPWPLLSCGAPSAHWPLGGSQVNATELGRLGLIRPGLLPDGDPQLLPLLRLPSLSGRWAHCPEPSHATFPMSGESGCRLGCLRCGLWHSSAYLSPTTLDLGHQETQWSGWALCRGSFPWLRVPRGPGILWPGLQSLYRWMETGIGAPCTRGTLPPPGSGSGLLRVPFSPCTPLGCGGRSDPVPLGPGHPAALSGLRSFPGAGAGGGGSRARGQPVQERPYWWLLCTASCFEPLGCQAEACVGTRACVTPAGPQGSPQGPRSSTGIWSSATAAN